MLSPEQRERETAKTAAEVLLSERHLANLIWKAIDKVCPRCTHRTADPTAVLGLEIVPRQHLHRWSRNGRWVLGRVGLFRQTVAVR